MSDNNHRSPTEDRPLAEPAGAPGEGLAVELEALVLRLAESREAIVRLLVAVEGDAAADRAQPGSGGGGPAPGPVPRARRGAVLAVVLVAVGAVVLLTTLVTLL